MKRKKEASPFCLCKMVPVAQMLSYSCSLELLGAADALLMGELLFRQALSNTMG